MSCDARKNGNKLRTTYSDYLCNELKTSGILSRLFLIDKSAHQMSRIKNEFVSTWINWCFDFFFWLEINKLTRFAFRYNSSSVRSYWKTSGGTSYSKQCEKSNVSTSSGFLRLMQLKHVHHGIVVLYNFLFTPLEHGTRELFINVGASPREY